MPLIDEFSHWKCVYCGTENDYTDWKCFNCHKKKLEWSEVKKIIASRENKKQVKDLKDRQEKMQKIDESSPIDDSQRTFDTSRLKPHWK